MYQFGIDIVRKMFYDLGKRCIMDDFGQYLKSLRQEHSLSLRDVGAKATISSSYLAQIEQGRRRPPGPDILKRLAPVYYVPGRGLLKAAGYLEEGGGTLSDEEEVE